MKTTAKRRRSKKQIDAEKEQEEWKKAETVRKIQRLEQLERDHSALQQRIDDSERIHQQVQGYMDQGLLVDDGNGNPIINAQAVINSERQSMASAPRQNEADQIIPNRREARVFGMN